eukprot:12980264-Alexandrium_andersonii.AAC.1
MALYRDGGASQRSQHLLTLQLRGAPLFGVAPYPLRPCKAIHVDFGGLRRDLWSGSSRRSPPVSRRASSLSGAGAGSARLLPCAASTLCTTGSAAH